MGLLALGSVLSFYFLYGSYRELSRLPAAVVPPVSSDAVQSGHTQSDSGHVSKSDADSEPLLALDEFYLNLTSSREPESTFSVGLKLELALFEGTDLVMVKNSLSGIRDAIIESARSQDYFHLKTLAGKLYFKEVIIDRVNGFLQAPAVRDVRFSAMLFQR